MNDRRFLGLMVLAGVLVVVAAATAIIGFRSETVRDENRLSAACTRAARPGASEADLRECRFVIRQIQIFQPLDEMCVIQRRTLRSGWYERITRCPPVNRP